MTEENEPERILEKYLSNDDTYDKYYYKVLCQKCREEEVIACKYNYNVMSSAAIYNMDFSKPNDREEFDENHSNWLNDMFAKKECVQEAPEMRQRHEDVEVKNFGNYSLIYFAIVSDCPHMIQEFIDSGGDINQTILRSKFKKGILILHLAVYMNKPRVVQQLLHSGVNVHQSDSKKYTALHLAVKKGYTDIARLLLSHGGKIDEITSEGNTPLMLATKRGAVDVFHLLIKYGADIDQRNVAFSKKLINIAIENHDTFMVQTILDHGVDVNVIDEFGNMLLLRVAKVFINPIRDHASLHQVMEHFAASDESGSKILRSLLSKSPRKISNNFEHPWLFPITKKFHFLYCFKLLLIHGASYECLGTIETFCCTNEEKIRKKNIEWTISCYRIAREMAGLPNTHLNNTYLSSINEEKLKEFQEGCKKEVEVMRSKKLIDGLTVLQFLRFNTRQLANLVLRQVSSAFHEFIPFIDIQYPIYSQMIRKNWYIGFWCGPIFDKAVTSLGRIVDQRLPPEVLLIITSNLEYNDLKTLIEIAE